MNCLSALLYILAAHLTEPLYGVPDPYTYLNRFRQALVRQVSKCICYSTYLVETKTSTLRQLLGRCLKFTILCKVRTLFHTQTRENHLRGSFVSRRHPFVMKTQASGLLPQPSKLFLTASFAAAQEHTCRRPGGSVSEETVAASSRSASHWSS